MSFPVAHGLVGASVVAGFARDLSPRRDWGKLLLGAAVANVPDLDYFALIKVFHFPESWHRGPLHSITFALLVGVCAALVLSGPWLRQTLIFWAATASHGFLDLFSRNPVEIFWPWSAARVDFGMSTYYSMSQMRAEPVMSQITYMAKICLFEFVIFAPVFLLVLLIRKRLNRQ